MWLCIFPITWGRFLHTCLQECFPSLKSFYYSSHYCILWSSLKNEGWWCCWKSSVKVQGKVKVASDLGGIVLAIFVKISWTTSLSKHQVGLPSGWIRSLYNPPALDIYITGFWIDMYLNLLKQTSCEAFKSASGPPFNHLATSRRKW